MEAASGATYGWTIDTNATPALQETYNKFKTLTPEEMTQFLMTVLVGPQTIQATPAESGGKKEDKKGIKKSDLRNVVAGIVTRHHGAGVELSVKTLLEEQKLKLKTIKATKKMEEKAAKKAAKEGAVKA